ncbi:MAG TPA: GNAT family N-acetyltransferase [Candidatus Fimivivens sp.]|nr:GNAT family N-acetyltransferase [Candidatus Fimivivens sp.]
MGEIGIDQTRVTRNDHYDGFMRKSVHEMTAGRGNGGENVACSEFHTGVTDSVSPELRREWSALWEKSPLGNVFNSVEWFEVFLETFRLKEFRIVTCRRQGVLCAVLPLVRGWSFGVPVMTAAGRRGNYVDRPPLLLESDDRDMIHATVREAMRLGIVYLPEVHETSMGSLTATDSISMASEPVCVNRQVELSPELDTLRHMSSRQRRKIRSVSRSETAFSLRIFDESPDAGLEAVIEVEQNSSKPRRHMALFDKPETRRLFETVAKNAPRFLRIAAIYDGGRPVATSTGFVWKGVYAGYHSAFDESYRRFAPGKALVYLLLEALKSEGYRKADFLRGDSTLKKDFASDLYVQYDVLISDSALVLRYWKTAFRIRNVLKKAVLVARHVENSIFNTIMRRHG